MEDGMTKDETVEKALARIQILSHEVLCAMEGRLVEEHKRAHMALNRINADASAALAAIAKATAP